MSRENRTVAQSWASYKKSSLRRSAVGLIAASVCYAGFATPLAASSDPAPSIAVARAAVDEAQRSGAVKYAPVELNNARNKLNMAEEAARKRDKKQAVRLADEAAIDAKLAQTTAEAGKTEEAARAVEAGNAALEQEVNRPLQR